MDLNETYARIGEYIKSRPSETYGQIAGTLGLSRGAIARIAKLQGIRRSPGKRACLEAALAAIDAASQMPGCAPAGEAPAQAEEPNGTASGAATAETAVL